MPALASIGGILLLARGALAHGDHMEAVPEGTYISAEPIVRYSTKSRWLQVLTEE